MTVTQEVQLWGGAGFTLVLVAFFIVAFFREKPWHAGQWVIVRILASLSAAFAAALFTGTALIDFRQTLGSGGVLGFQGTAGFALFFVIWYFFPRQQSEVAQRPQDNGNITLPAGMRLADAAKLVASKDLDHSRGIDFVGFGDTELKAPLLSDALINLKDGRIALRRLRDFTGDAVRPYEVTLKEDRYQLEHTSS